MPFPNFQVRDRLVGELEMAATADDSTTVCSHWKSKSQVLIPNLTVVRRLSVAGLRGDNRAKEYGATGKSPLHTPFPVGDEDVAPPGMVWTEEGTHKGRPYGDRRGSLIRCFGLIF